MLENLEKARKEENVTLLEMANALGISRPDTVRKKIDGKYPFKFDEALTLKKKFFPDYDLTFLFSKKEYTH